MQLEFCSGIIARIPVFFFFFFFGGGGGGGGLSSKDSHQVARICRLVCAFMFCATKSRISVIFCLLKELHKHL